MSTGQGTGTDTDMERTRVEPTGAPDSAEEARDDVARGAEVGRYVILDALGAGGMGEVFAAYDPELDRRVALKLVRVGGREDTVSARGRLLREAQALAKLSHPNVVTVFDAGTHGDRVFIAMEHVEGITLRRWMKEHPPQPGTWREALELLMQAGRGLAAAHAEGIVHRDFKPANVMVSDDGRVRVLDFGLARRFGGDDTEDEAGEDAVSAAPIDVLQSLETGRSSLRMQLTQTGTVMGTPSYMAPEQFFGGSIDARTDQFAYCVVLYRALFGQRPFAGETFAELGRAVARGELQDVPGGSGVPRGVQAAVLRGLAVSRDERHSSMDALLAELERCLGQGRRRVLLAGAGMVAVAAAVGLASRGGTEPVCQGAEARLEGIWDDARRDALGAAFTATGLAFAEDAREETVALLDAYATRWVETRTETCEATRVRGDQSEALMDLRIGCLDGRLRDVSALTDVLVAADADVVEHAVEAALELHDPRPCAELDPIATALEDPTEPERAAEVERARERVAEARALLLAGKNKEAGQVGDEALEVARLTEHRPVVAEAAITRALIHERQNELEPMEQAYEEALLAAEACGYGRVEARALIGLLSLHGHHRGEADLGLRYGRHADAVLERIDDPVDLRAALLLYTGNVLFRAGRFDEAVAHLQQVIPLADEVAESNRTLMAALTNLGAIQATRGNYQEAVSSSREVVRRSKELLGPLHPLVGKSENNLAVSLMRLGRIDEAMEHQRSALEIYTAGLGADHPDAIRAQHNLGVMYAELGQHDAALREYQKAFDAKVRALGPDNPSVAHSANNMGQALVDLGRPAEAIPHFEEALRIWTVSSGPDHNENVYGLVGIAQAHVAKGTPAEALPVVRRALPLLEKHEYDPAMLGEIRFIAAQVVGSGGRPEDLREARALAERALSDYGDSQRPSQEEMDEIQRWIREHPAEG